MKKICLIVPLVYLLHYSCFLSCNSNVLECFPARLTSLSVCKQPFAILKPIKYFQMISSRNVKLFLCSFLQQTKIPQMFFLSVFYFFCICFHKGIHVDEAFYLLSLPYAMFLIRILCQTTEFVSKRNLPLIFLKVTH